MISLVQLLKEVMSSPKAIILSGGAGSGKSYITKTLLGDLKGDTFTPQNSDLKFKYLNPDEFVEKENLPLANAMQKFREKFSQTEDKAENILWDTTGANAKNTLSSLPGYKKFMVMVYTHPLVSILQNAKRGRTLPLDAVLRTWDQVYGNIETYKKAFGDNFVLIPNILPEYKNEIQEFDNAIKGGKEGIEKYLQSIISKNPQSFKSTFSKEFDFQDKNMGQEFSKQLNLSSYNSKTDEIFLKDLKKAYEKESSIKNSFPNSEFINKKLKSLNQTKQKNYQQYNENLEGIIAKLSSPEFLNSIKPTENIQGKLNQFLND